MLGLLAWPGGTGMGSKRDHLGTTFRLQKGVRRGTRVWVEDNQEAGNKEVVW